MCWWLNTKKTSDFLKTDKITGVFIKWFDKQSSSATGGQLKNNKHGCHRSRWEKNSWLYLTFN